MQLSALARIRAVEVLPDPARTDEKVGVGEAILFDRVLQRARDVLLADEVVEGLGPIFARENLIAHTRNLVRRAGGENGNSERETGLAGLTGFFRPS